MAKVVNTIILQIDKPQIGRIRQVSTDQTCVNPLDPRNLWSIDRITFTILETKVEYLITKYGS